MKTRIRAFKAGSRHNPLIDQVQAGTGLSFIQCIVNKYDGEIIGNKLRLERWKNDHCG
jgi:hypothetical protein